MQPHVAGGNVLSVVVGYTPNYSADYPAFLESLSGVLEGLPSGDPNVQLGYDNAHVGNDGATWREVIGTQVVLCYRTSVLTMACLWNKQT